MDDLYLNFRAKRKHTRKEKWTSNELRMMRTFACVIFIELIGIMVLLKVLLSYQ